jgi:hypothetical protein
MIVGGNTWAYTELPAFTNSLTSSDSPAGAVSSPHFSGRRISHQVGAQSPPLGAHYSVVNNHVYTVAVASEKGSSLNAHYRRSKIGVLITNRRVQSVRLKPMLLEETENERQRSPETILSIVIAANPADVLLANKKRAHYARSPTVDVFCYGEVISTAFVESTVNQVTSKRMVKKQQMRWTKQGAHLLLQVRLQTLNGDLRDTFCRWYPDMTRTIQNVSCFAPGF